ncbi:MAG: glycoside hydrolase family 31 protein [Verrucomicrobiota bacterium]|nr:glycoside hydrolase family 31 protein [Verrucomicrobiota bacterium]
MTNATYDVDSYASVLPEKTVHQHSDRIFHRNEFSYDEVSTITEAHLNASTLVASVLLTSGIAATLRVHVIDTEVLRVQLTLDGYPDPVEQHSDMLVPFSGKVPALQLQSGVSAHRLTFGNRTLVLEQSPFQLRIEDAQGKPVFETENYPLAGKPLVGALGFRSRKGARSLPSPYLSWSIRNDEKFFGLGEKWNKVEKSSTRATVWASDTCGSNSNDLSYKSIPYLLSSRGWGLFLHSSFRSVWEVGSFCYVSGSCLLEDDHLDAFLFLGNNLKSLIGTYTAITGRPAMPPKWALGLWMSRCQYEKQSEAEEAMNGLRSRGIPADVIHLDPLWMQTHYYFKIGVDACDFVKNDAAFPALPALWKKWRANGFKTCLWINPYLPEGTAIYDYAAANNYLLKSTQGGLARLSHGEPVGMVDFSNPEARAWWKGKLKEVLSQGAAVLKPDYGDRVPEDALFSNGKTGLELHNLYLFWFTETCYQACQEVHGYGMVWRRAGYIGSQRYPGTWAGDTRSTWEEMLACLRGGLSAGYNGDAFWAGDIGGFTGPKPTPELYIRWAQWGLLSPLARFHGANSPREPWHFGETAVSVVKHYAQLRYRLMPYLVRCAEEACATGLPILRHMHLEYPDEPGTATIDDQYLLGPDLLIAPIFSAGALERDVYFPAGQWIDFDNPEKSYDGRRYHRVPAPLERIPLFRRAGASIPTDETLPQFIA